MWSERRSKLAQLSMTVASPSLSGKSPIDDEFAERTSLRLHVTVTITGGITRPTTVVDVDHTSGSLDSCLFPVEPAELLHDNSFWSRAESRNSPRSGASQAQWLWVKRRPLRLQRLILYINTRILCQAILRKSQ